MILKKHYTDFVFSLILGLSWLFVLGFNSIIDTFHTQKDTYFYYVPNFDEVDAYYVSFPFIGKTFLGFKEAIGQKESEGNYLLVNEYGYLGKYQFGKNTLKSIGIDTPAQAFLKDYELQEKAFATLLSKNKWELRKELKKYNGKTINGIRISESGLLAAAHLAGVGSVKKFLRSNGRNAFRDAFGTNIRTYMYRFSDYNTTEIQAVKDAKVTK